MASNTVFPLLGIVFLVAISITEVTNTTTPTNTTTAGNPSSVKSSTVKSSSVVSSTVTDNPGDSLSDGNPNGSTDSELKTGGRNTKNIAATCSVNLTLFIIVCICLLFTQHM